MDFPEKRVTCRTEVMTAAGETSLSREEREALHEARGLAKQAHRDGRGPLGRRANAR